MNYSVSFLFFCSFCLPACCLSLMSPSEINTLNFSSYWSPADLSNCTDIDTIEVSAGTLSQQQSDTQTEPKVKINIKVRGMTQTDLDRLTYMDEHKQLNDTHSINIPFFFVLNLLCISVQKMQRRWPGSSSPSPTASCPMRRWASTRLAVTQYSSCRRVIYLCSSSSVCRCLKW